MSLLAVQGGATGTGTVTILAPVTNTNRTLTLPDATDTVAGIAATQTLTNKTLTSPTLTTPALGTPTSGILTSCTGVQYDGFKNRIINGAMVIDQRSGGASVTLSSASSSYGLDRFLTVNGTDGTITYQQVVDAPSGFYNSTKLTVTTADASLSAAQTFRYIQRIEANNLADFNLGTASAKTFTVSFWVKSSLTGTFAFAVNNYNVSDQSYVTSYTINSANTWEQKSITITAPTTGTFNTGTGVGLEVVWGLGIGTNFNTATQNQWVAANVYSFSGATSVVGTLNATWNITGVQLEKGSTATSFDYLPFGTEVALCQRYFTTSFQNGATPASPNSLSVAQTGLYFINGASSVSFPVLMRTAPTVTCFAPLTSPAINNVRVGNTGSIVAGTVSFIGEKSFTQFGPTDGVAFQFGYTASAEL